MTDRKIVAAVHKRGRGRPPGSGTGVTPGVFIRIAPALRERIDAYQQRHALPDRSEAIRRLIERGLEAVD